VHYRRLTIATILACVSGCSAGENRATGDIGGTLVIALPAEPKSLMPPYLFYVQEKPIADQIFDVLAEIGPDLNTLGDAGWTPRLAESWTWAADSLSITFRLKPNAKWHDGEKVTSSDVRFTLDLNKDPKVGSRFASSFTDIDSISTPDLHTAGAWYSRRSPEQFYNLVYNLLLVPEHLLKDADRSKLAEHPYARNPVGSGPFRFVRWAPRTLLEVAADTTYHMGRPMLDRVIWTLNPQPDAALVAVLAAEADMYENMTMDGMTRIAGQSAVKAVPYASPNYGFLGFNLHDPKNPRRPHPLFGDRELRRALAMAIDRKVLLKNVYDSLGFLGSGPFSRRLATADTALAMPPFDSAGADRLLDSLGWRDTNRDGIRDKGGRVLRFGVLFPASSVQRRQYAELIQAQLRPHGVRVDVDGPDITVAGPRFLTGQFDAFLHNWLSDPSPSSIRDTWYSANPDNRGSNFLLYSNLAVDAAIDSAMRETDPTRSRAHYLSAYQQIIDDVPGVWLYENRNYMAINGRVKPVLNGSHAWWRHLRLWSIPKAGRLPRDGP
jgi:peptide/nickel transport system substrate-binding protein